MEGRGTDAAVTGWERCVESNHTEIPRDVSTNRTSCLRLERTERTVPRYSMINEIDGRSGRSVGRGLAVGRPRCGGEMRKGARGRGGGGSRPPAVASRPATLQHLRCFCF